MSGFLILGQPRSGTTYLQTLLNAHPGILCRGELFDPWQIDDNGRKTRGLDAVIARDSDPESFMDRMLAGDGVAHPASTIGAKLLHHHHTAIVTRYIPAHPALRLIHVRRENKLAQFASVQQVRATGRWVETDDRAAPPPRIDAKPQWAAAECNRLEIEDFLHAAWLRTLPNPVLRVTYRGLFATDFAKRVQAFLGVTPRPGLTSPLLKQGQNRVLDRFADPDPIARYFIQTGRSAWLDPEL